MNIGIFSFFSGVGLLDLGFENTGYEILEVFEKKETFLDMYRYSREKMGYTNPKYGYSLGDVEKLLEDNELSSTVRAEKQTKTVGFIGGPPCPDFSIAGKNKGAEGENGRLSTVYFELIKKNRPDFFLFENVKGIWKTTKNRHYIESKMDEMKKSGYTVVHGVLNALDYGVPQDRERFIILGVEKNFLEKENVDITSFFSLLNSEDDKKNLYNWPTIDQFQEGSKKPFIGENNKALTIQYWFDKNDVNSHANRNDYFKPKSIGKFESISEGDISKKSFKRLHRWRYSPTAAYGNNEVHLHPYQKRRLSISEVLAIQSAPKEFELPNNVTLTDKFKVVGNAVPYLMSLAIAEKLKLVLEGEL